MGEGSFERHFGELLTMPGAGAGRQGGITRASGATVARGWAGGGTVPSRGLKTADKRRQDWAVYFYRR